MGRIVDSFRSIFRYIFFCNRQPSKSKGIYIKNLAHHSEISHSSIFEEDNLQETKLTDSIKEIKENSSKSVISNIPGSNRSLNNTNHQYDIFKKRNSLKSLNKSSEKTRTKETDENILTYNDVLASYSCTKSKEDENKQDESANIKSKNYTTIDTIELYKDETTKLDAPKINNIVESSAPETGSLRERISVINNDQQEDIDQIEENDYKVDDHLSNDTYEQKLERVNSFLLKRSSDCESISTIDSETEVSCFINFENRKNMDRKLSRKMLAYLKLRQLDR